MTIAEIAKLANVSIATVSHVINNTKNVSSELREKINNIINENNYRPNTLATGLKGKKTYTIAVVIPKITAAFFPPVLQGIEDCAKSKNYNILYLSTNDNFDEEIQCIERITKSVDGIILDSYCPIQKEAEYSKYLSELSKKNKKIAVVSIERIMDYEKISSVSVDNVRIGYLLTNNLIQLGCKNIAHISGPLQVSLVTERKNGYEKALLENGLKIDPSLIIEGNFSMVSGYASTKSLIINRKKFDGIFCVNDESAIGAIKALKETNIRIPEQVKIAGVDNNLISSLVNPGVTTANVPRYQIGFEATNILLKHIEEEKYEPIIKMLDFNIVFRQSTEKNTHEQWDLFGR